MSTQTEQTHKHDFTVRDKDGFQFYTAQTCIHCGVEAKPNGTEARRENMFEELQRKTRRGRDTLNAY